MGQLPKGRSTVAHLSDASTNGMPAGSLNRRRACTGCCFPGMGMPPNGPEEAAIQSTKRLSVCSRRSSLMILPTVKDEKEEEDTESRSKSGADVEDEENDKGSSQQPIRGSSTQEDKSEIDEGAEADFTPEAGSASNGV